MRQTSAEQSESRLFSIFQRGRFVASTEVFTTACNFLAECPNTVLPHSLLIHDGACPGLLPTPEASPSIYGYSKGPSLACCCNCARRSYRAAGCNFEHCRFSSPDRYSGLTDLASRCHRLALRRPLPQTSLRAGPAPQGHSRPALSPIKCVPSLLSGRTAQRLPFSTFPLFL